MSVFINLGNFSDKPVNVANPCVAGGTVTFNAILAVDTSKYNNRKKVAVLFADAKTPEAASVLFSVTANNARFNTHKEKCAFDSDPAEFINFNGGTTKQFLDYLKDKFGDFTTKNAFQVTFGDAGHFTNDEGEIVKTILAIDKIEAID